MQVRIVCLAEMGFYSFRKKMHLAYLVHNIISIYCQSNVALCPVERLTAGVVSILFLYDISARATDFPKCPGTYKVGNTRQIQGSI